MPSAMILGVLTLTHFTGQMKLLAPAWVWGAVFVYFNGLPSHLQRILPDH